MSPPDHFKKKWMIVIKVNVGQTSPEEVDSYMEQTKNSLSQQKFDSFFETETFCLYVPVRKAETTIEFHEIILNGFGYDKYELIVKDNNLTIKNILDSIKELLDDNEK